MGIKAKQQAAKLGRLLRVSATSDAGIKVSSLESRDVAFDSGHGVLGLLLSDGMFSRHQSQWRDIVKGCRVFLIFFFLHSFIFERQRQSVSRGGAEREGDTES